jgi:hypothetical protein
VVVVLVFVVFVVSLVFSVLDGGFTTVVLCSVFFSAGELAGATTSVFCSHAPRSEALAKMQSNFFIVWIGCPCWDNGGIEPREVFGLAEMRLSQAVALHPPAHDPDLALDLSGRVRINLNPLPGELSMTKSHPSSGACLP